MKLSLEKVEALCREHGVGVTSMLMEAGVSRNAYYTLARNESVVPRSLIKIAEHFGVSVSRLLDDVVSPAERLKDVIARTDRIRKRYRNVDADNVRHTLILLEEEPIERLRRALRRGQPVNIR